MHQLNNLINFAQLLFVYFELIMFHVKQFNVQV